MSFLALAEATYIAIESYRRDGKGVRTPVSIVAADDKLFCWTVGNSGKVKRIHNSNGVKLAKCDAKGNVQGEWIGANARIIYEGDEAKAVSRRVLKQHGLLFMIFNQLFRLICILRRQEHLAIEFNPALDETPRYHDPHST